MLSGTLFKSLLTTSNAAEHNLVSITVAHRHCTTSTTTSFHLPQTTGKGICG